MSSMLALHVLAAERGDGLRPELVEALKRQALMDRLASIPMSPGAFSPAGGAVRFLPCPAERKPRRRNGRQLSYPSQVPCTAMLDAASCVRSADQAADCVGK